MNIRTLALVLAQAGETAPAETRETGFGWGWFLVLLVIVAIVFAVLASMGSRRKKEGDRFGGPYHERRGEGPATTDRPDIHPRPA